MEITGQGGTIVCGSRHVATLGPWRLSRTLTGWTFTGQPRHINPFWWTQGPQRVTLPMAARSWTWVVENLPDLAETIAMEFAGAPRTAPFT
ncbi:MAG: hypothetical protein NUW22_12590 [Acidobacteria bacterium]|nr:hypothetical protein [Acidobacteriota bacterium]